jgi:hypothetical protein
MTRPEVNEGPGRGQQASYVPVIAPLLRRRLLSHLLWVRERGASDSGGHYEINECVWGTPKEKRCLSEMRFRKANIDVRKANL